MTATEATPARRVAGGGDDDALRGWYELLRKVEAEPYAFDFFALLRRIEGLMPDRPRLGLAKRPSQEPLRFGQEAELQFAPAALACLDLARPVPLLTVRFFGLLGPQGPMPRHLTEFVRERLRQDHDPVPQRFLDLFHHRMLLLFYRAWAQCQPVVQHDRPDEDRFAVWLGALCGQHHAPDAAITLPWNALLHQAGLIASRSPHPEALVKVLAFHFKVAVQVIEHVGHWIEIAAEDRSRLGGSAKVSPGRNARVAQLGVSAIAGTRAWDRQFKFRVVLGPLTLAQYLGFMPGGQAWRELGHWIRQVVGLDIMWEVELRLACTQVPQIRIGRDAQLGRTAWLGQRERDRDRRDRGDLRLQQDAESRMFHRRASAGYGGLHG